MVCAEASQTLITFLSKNRFGMEVIMDIAGLSMAMSSAKTNDAFSVAMLAKTLDQAESTGSQVVGMMDAAAMELSVNPHIGGNFDMSV